MEQRINQDLKVAMLAKDKAKVEVLKGLKNAFLYEAVAQNLKEKGLDEAQTQKVLAREAKKRSEAAKIYKNVGEDERAKKELAERAIIDTYLPQQLSETEILAALQGEIKKLGASSIADMGRVIGAVKARLGASADGATIAKLAKKELE
jgi:uncharacterized protein YqeY